METDGNRGNAGYAAFRAAMLEGRLRPGTVHTQAELCEVLGMSLSPLRDTLTLLESDGLVTIRRRAGITIVSPDVPFIRRNFQFRALIEREAMRQFSELADEAWIAEMGERHRAALRSFADKAPAGELEETLRVIDWDFHSGVVAALHNPMIAETHFRLQENIRLARVLNAELAAPSKAADALREHMAILDRLAARDAPGAEEALEAHFRAAVHRAFAG